MLSSQQLDTLSGIVCHYDSYVVYYYADYHTYTYNEERDSRIVIYCGNSDSITVDNNTFTFSGDVSCYYLTSSKYLVLVSCPASFTVPPQELVYTNLVESYPEICYSDSLVSNTTRHFDFGYWFVLVAVVLFGGTILFRILFGGGRA